MGSAESERPRSNVKPTVRCKVTRRPLLVSAVLLVLVGVLVRIQGISQGLWYDEAAWANRLESGVMWGDARRPLGYTAVSEFVTWIWNSELTLRLPSLLASVGMLPLGYALARSIFKSQTLALAALLVLALHSVLISFAKEFKPYAVDAFSHVVLLLWTQRYCAQPSRRRAEQVVARAGTVVDPAPRGKHVDGRPMHTGRRRRIATAFPLGKVAGAHSRASQ